MRIYLIILLLTIPIVSNSQQIGIKAGYMVSKVQELKSGIAPIAGVFFATKGDLYFNGEINYRNISGSISVPLTNINNQKTGEANKSYSFKYIELPLMVGVKSGQGKIIPFVNIGVVPAFLFSSQYDHKNITVPNNFNLSACISPGLMMSERVSLEARLSKSFTGIYNNNNFNYLSFSFLLGYRFKK